MQTLQAVKGMNDLLPSDLQRWERVESAFRRTTALYGYGEIRTPMVEPTALFVRSIGEVTDIVEKEMYTFVDKGEHSITLRPEGTASAARAYLEHKVYAVEPITKWIYIGPMFRRERPAKGRYRQFYQLGAELYGDPGPFCDAEMIDMVATFIREIGLTEIEVLVNSLGGPSTRPAYKDALVAYLAPHEAELCGDCQRRIKTNPLRVLDCKVPGDAEIAKGAPSILEHLSADDRAHFDGLLRTLDVLGTPYRVEPRLVRGLDYYTRTLFEVRASGGDLGAQNTVCGGGRYDGMVEGLGGPPTPAIGFAMGLERLLLATPKTESTGRVDVAVAYTSAELATEATKLARDLRLGGIATDVDLRAQSLKSQLRRADKLGVKLVVVVGEDELARGAVQLKSFVDKSQRDVARGEIVAAARAALRPTP